MKNILGLIGLLALVFSTSCKQDVKSASAQATIKENTEVITKPMLTKEATAPEAMGKFKVEEVAKVETAQEKMITKDVMDGKVKVMTEKVAVEPMKKVEAAMEKVETKVQATTTEIKETATKTVTEKVASVVPKAKKPTPTKTEIVAKPDPKPVVQKVEKAPVTKFAPMHEIFDALLKKYVSNSGKVDYAGIKSEEAVLDGYLKTLSTTSLTGKSKKEKLAFWINAYNAFTIKKIVKNYPIASITDLDGGKPWDTKWIKIDGQNLSLNNIENDIIRPKYNEPRIHFAVNCAAKSCPPLLNKAWTADNLESNLEKQTKSFINSAHNTISPDKLTLSKIFDWYGEDFGNLESYIRKYASSTVAKGVPIEFGDYDWSLNN